MSDNGSSEDEGLFQMGEIHNPRGGGRPKSVQLPEQVEVPTYEKPNYAAAMEYWNTLLPRRVKDSSQPSGYRQALVGELFDEHGEPAELYDFFKTDSGALDEFGIGMSLYFRTLKILGLVCFVCALILLVSVEENKKNQNDVGFRDDSFLEFVEETIGICEVSHDYHSDAYIFDRNTTDAKLSLQWNLLGSAYGATPQSLSFGKQGVADLVILIICLVLMVLANRFEKREIEAIDIAQQTTQDYSVVVKNPPVDIKSEKEYYDFFSQFGEVVTLTVALRNGGLIKAIADRKMLSMKIDSMRHLEKLKTPEELLQEPTFVEKVMKLLGMDLISCEAKLEAFDKKILAMSNVDYPPWHIFVSFNKEEEQRQCLVELATPDFKFSDDSYFKSLNSIFKIDEEAEPVKFHDYVLDVQEAPEPGDVIYDHTHRKKPEVYLRYLISYSITGLVIFCVMLVITVLQNVQGTIAELLVALFIAGMNAGLPVGIRMLTQIVEAHSSETNSQLSVLWKLMIARCMNSAVLIYVLTPWHSQFSLENMRQIQFILLSDALITPFFRYLNLFDVVKRHFIAPVVFGKTQAGYNSQFQGTKWTLAERYTDALKSVFAGFFFAVPLPTGLFITSFSMMTTYMVDKYSLMRVWERKPTVDHSLAKLSRYFLITTLWTHTFISMKYFANWPYSYGGLPKDASCDVNCEECPVRVDEIHCRFFIFFCDPDRAYMTETQYWTVLVFLVFSLVIGGLILFFFLFYRTGKKILKHMGSEPAEIGEASDIPLRSVFGAPAYVPTIKLKQMTAPFVFSDIGKLPIRFSPVRQNAGWDETVDPKNFSLVDPSLYPQVSDVHFKDMFSTTSFYECRDFFQQLTEMSSTKIGKDDNSDSDSDSSDDSDQESNLDDHGQSGLHKNDHHRDQQITEEDFKTSSFMDTDSLPSAWERRITSDGRIFYVDHNEMKITHVAPPVVKAGRGTSFRVSSQQSFKKSKKRMIDDSDVQKQCESLPMGWEKKLTEKGKVYYTDHNTRQNHWKLPEKLKRNGSDDVPQSHSNLISKVDGDDDTNNQV